MYLFSPSKIRCLAYKEPMMTSDDGVHIYERAEENRIYTMCVDVSRGQGIDYHAFSLIDVTEIPYKVVATFRNNKIPPMVLPNLLHRILKEYNDAYCLIEINDIGGQVADILNYELEYENVLYTANQVGRGQELSGGFGSSKSKLGVRTTATVKRTGCSQLKSMIEDDKLMIGDYETISELSTFVSKKQSFEADSGKHDDLAMTLVLFGWLTSQPYFRDISDMDIRQKLYQDRIDSIEESLTPFGFSTEDNDMENIEVDDEGNVWFHDQDDDRISW